LWISRNQWIGIVEEEEDQYGLDISMKFKKSEIGIKALKERLPF